MLFTFYGRVYLSAMYNGFNIFHHPLTYICFSLAFIPLKMRPKRQRFDKRRDFRKSGLGPSEKCTILI